MTVNHSKTGIYRIFLALTCISLGSVSPSRGSGRLETLYTNFGSPPVKYVLGGWIEEGQSQSSGQANVFSFTVPQQSIARGIELALTGATHGTPVTIELAQDGADRPGKVVFSRKIIVPEINKCCRTVYVNIPKSKNVKLQPGLTYWAVTLAAPNTSAAWNFNSTNAHDPMSRSYDNGHTWSHAFITKYLNGAFAVYGIPTGN